VFDPGLGLVRAGFLFSRYGYDFRAGRSDPDQIRAKTSGARNPAPNAADLWPLNALSQGKAGQKPAEMQGFGP
jgi:hypothetical protein